MALVRYADNTTREVKNLGWLLRNAKDVDSFVVRSSPIRGRGATLQAFMLPDQDRENPALSFTTQFADLGLLKDWLNRPRFQGLEVTWFGNFYIIGDRYYLDIITHPHPES